MKNKDNYARGSGRAAWWVRDAIARVQNTVGRRSDGKSVWSAVNKAYGAAILKDVTFLIHKQIITQMTVL